MDELSNMGFGVVGHIAYRDGALEADIAEDIARREKCIYAIVIGGEIARIGSSKGPLRKRIRSYRRYFARAIERDGVGTQMPLWEAHAWRDRLLAAGGEGQVWARQGTVVETAIATLNVFLSEEAELIARYRPPLNRSGR